MNSPPDPCIVVVDDDPASLALCDQILLAAGYGNVHLFSSPGNVFAEIEPTQVDLLILDLQMPEVGGLDILRMFREEVPAESVAPVLVLTADTSMATRRKALAMGADDFLTKPVDVVEMTLRTKHWLRLREVHEALLASEENLASQVEERTRDLQETLTRLETTMELATQTEERYRSLFESIPVGVLRSNARTEILDANPAALRILSIPDLATARGLSMAELFEDQDAVQLALEEGTREGYLVGRELPMTALNGRRLWLRGSFRVIRTGDEVTALEGLIEDVTERKRAEIERELLLRATLSIVAATDTSEAVEKITELLAEFGSWSSAEGWLPTPSGLTRLCSWSPDSGIQRHLKSDDAMPNQSDSLEKRPEVGHDFDLEPWEKSLASQAGQAVVVLPVKTEEETVAVLVMKGSKDRSGGEPFQTETAEAVVAQLGIAVGAKRAYDRVLQLSEAKDQFIAAVSHELRTPLTSILGFADVIAETADGLSGEQKELLEMLGRESRSLATIIDNLTIAARTDIDAVGVSSRDIALGALVARLVGDLSGNRTHISNEVTGEIHAVGDPQRVELILRNLIANAARHSPRVSLRCKRQDTFASLQVVNRGQPISGRNQALMFEPFISLDVDPGQPRPMGLGLPVSRSLARLMGGDVTYRHHEGENIFDIKLPLALASVAD